ncbi:MAG: sodium/proline symporter [Clostridiales bacterium]|nr:sodium/proline symporter [Clostridiales bacterium]
MSSATIGMLTAILVYLAGMILIGFWKTKQNKTSDDFYLGGRRLGPLVTAMSAEASDMSSWLLMGLPGVAYLTGMAEASWTAIGLAIGTYLNWLFVARRIRRYTQACGNAITLPDFFSNRYHARNKALLSIAALIIVIFFIPYTASGFAACGKLFSSLFGADYLIAMIVSAVVIVAYTMLGGFLAASTTDLVQSIVMTAALLVVLVFGTVSAGGVQAVIDNARALPGYLSLVAANNVNTGAVGGYGFLTIVSTLAWGLGYFGMPHILLRFMAIEQERKLTLSRRVATVWVVISLAVATLIGVIGYGMTGAGKLNLLQGNASETILIKIAELLSTYGFFFALLAGVVLAGILASTMSTADSQLLAAASSVSRNLMESTLGIQLSTRASMLAARLTVLVISVIAVFIAVNPDSSVFRIVSFAWAGFGAAFGPVVLLALFWRRSNQWGALCGMIGGAGMVFVWKFLLKPMGGVWGIYELLPAFLFAIVLNVVVSLCTKAPEQAVLDEFDLVASKQDLAGAQQA